MKRNEKILLISLGVIMFLSASFWLGTYYQDYQITKKELAKAEGRLANIGQLAMNELYLQSASFADREGLTSQDQMLASIAMRKAKLCTNCLGYWEANGSSDYYSVPFRWIVSNEFGDAIYEIVPATMFKVSGELPTYAPAFAIYYSNRAGMFLRVNAQGEAYRQVGSVFPYEWVRDPLIDGAGLKMAAIKAALHAESVQPN